MNKQKMLEDRYAEINKDGPVIDGLFEGVACESCGGIHGTSIAGGGKLILTIVNNRILCYPHGIKEAQNTTRSGSFKRATNDLESFGLVQESLL